jgi:hypothetical protein
MFKFVPTLRIMVGVAAWFALVASFILERPQLWDFASGVAAAFLLTTLACCGAILLSRQYKQNK